MSEVSITERNYSDLITPDISDGIMRVYDHWANKSLKDVLAEMPEPTYIGIDEQRDVQLLELLPKTKDYDTSRTIALGLPFLNGLSPHQYIRAKTLQMLVDPNVPLIVMPNNNKRDIAYSLTDKDRTQLAKGDIRPIGAIEVRAFEELDKKVRRLGTLSITGYSQGALTALAMGAFGSNRLHVDVINADEAPSKTGRSPKQLKKDFLAGGPLDVPNEAKDTDIDALMQAVSLPRFALDIARFGIQSAHRDSKLIQGAMANSADGLVADVAASGVPVKLGYVKTSPMFDPDSIDPRNDNFRVVGYGGNEFKRGHAVGDNVITHALMANDGLSRNKQSRY